MKYLATLGVLAVLATSGSVIAANPPETKEKLDKFYGKIVHVDPNQREFTVRNGTKKTQSRFNWDSATKIVSQKKDIPASDLAVGQSLIVSYRSEGEANIARRIVVRKTAVRNTKNIRVE